ncbi:MAG: MFS transporter permease [Desulfosalsimonas sp.]
MKEAAPTIVIPKEEAVFRLGGDGWWRNEAGRIRKKKIVDYLHKCIDRDENGYFVLHDKGGKWEKVYFPYEDTALFVFDISRAGEGLRDIVLVLNTGRNIPLKPENLYIHNDSLYMARGQEKIKFAERALVKFSKLLTEDENGRLVLKSGGHSYVIPEK